MGFIRFVVLSVASVGFISYAPHALVPFKKWKGGGFIGSAVGWCVLWYLPESGSWFWILMAGALVLSVAVSHYAEKWMGSHDDPRIIIDEVVGVWVACVAIPRLGLPMVLGFVFFRFFDVLKSPLVRRVATLPGGFGVVADDVVAGIFANVCVRLVMGLLAL